jgi:3-oxoadipate enol-lactonase
VTAPERVASLTLLCSAAGGYPWPAEAEDPDGEAEYERLAAAEDLDGLTELYLRTFAASGADDYLRAQFRATTELELSGADVAEQNPPQWDDAPGISVPVAVVVGERDERASRIGGLALAERIPGAELVRLDADHLPQYRDPAAVAEVVLRTVARA